MIPVRGVQGRKVAVLGLGRSGLAAAEALRAGGARVLAWDDSEPARARAMEAGLEPVDISRPAALEDAAALVVSPGIAHLYPEPHPVVAAALAAGVPLDNDVGLFFRSFATPAWERFDTAPRVVAVTGTNGKSTTVSLLHHVLAASGRPTQLAGNIGRGVLDLEPARDGEVVILELSSYQLELARALTPDIAVLTNIAPDHLDRHGGRGGYFAAKRRLFAEGGPDRAVIGIDEMEGRFLAAQMAEGPADDRVIRTSAAGARIGGPGWAVFARKGFLVEMRKGRQVASIDLRAFRHLPGAHNHHNVCSAWAVCRSLGLAPRAIAAGIASFPGLPHRCELVAEAGGVAFVNDSKATNVDSALVALRAFPRVRWICGGLEKPGSLAPLRAEAGRVARAYVIGREAEAFALKLAPVPTEVCTTMERAVARAMEDAEPGETVLLAPAAASFDQYDNFERRGEDFVNQVRQRLGATGSDASVPEAPPRGRGG